MASRGIRNCNPGNIRRSRVRYVGELAECSDPEYKQFESMAYGYRAMFVLLDTYRCRYGLTTIRQMINRYAPPKENFTEGYIRFIVSSTGIAPDEEVDTRAARDMVPIVRAMSEIENGVKAVREDVERGWELFTSSVK